MKLTGTRGLFFVLAGVGLLTATPACRRSDRSDPVAARVGNLKITVEDLRARLRETPAAYQQYVATAEGRRQFLDLLIREKVLLAEAQSLGISRDPSYRTAVDKFKAEWMRRLREYEDTLQVESTLRRLRAKELAATDSDVEKYYTEHRADFEKPLEIQTSHILLASEAAAQTALARLAAGDSFEQVARALSRDPATAVHGGKMDPF